MPTSHHRKKHKEHLRQYQHSTEGTSKLKKAKVAGTFAIIGAILAVAITYFATDGNVTWIAFAAVAAGLAGYLAGTYIDKQGKK